VIYAAAVPAAFLAPVVAWGCYFGVALIWLIPDRRIERTLAE